ncbi:hypothetical protein ID866_5753 [Astraeus odoratus]|nr:hypothetical protein ID866_5753 [Astraeus odoratus]
MRSTHSSKEAMSVFTPPDLSNLAHNLDALEQSYNSDSRGRGSTNMDDTGFFSVQVLESALELWGLSLVRWRSEAMKPHQSKPHMQLAFILNQNQHWYTLRRFGLTAEDGHWFNLDSSEREPRWIGKTYLDLFLQQAEQDGYSVFAVTPAHSGSDLPRTQADEVAASLPESLSTRSTSSSVLQTSSSEIGLEDEDMDLQAALQASLAGYTSHHTSTISQFRDRHTSVYPPPHVSADRDFPGIRRTSTVPMSSSSQIHPSGSSRPPNQDPYGHADVDPVTASIERNRIIMERMRREQEMALREQYEEEVAAFGSARQRRQQGTMEEDDEEEHIRRAIEASLRNAPRTGEPEVNIVEGSDDEDDDDDYQPTPPAEPTHRVYDDDDAALQAALRASLETVPPGFILPPSPRPRPVQRCIDLPPVAPSEREVEMASDAGDDASHTESDASKEEELSVEEIRRRRLARFGG